MSPEKCLELMDLMENLKRNTRHSWLSDGRKESVAEHSWRLAVLALFSADNYPNIDREKLLKMCLLHDVGEAFTGDIPAFEKTANDDKNEKEAVYTWLAKLDEPQKSELTGLFDEMYAMQTDEARLTVALDKMETLIQHDEADIKTWLPREYTDNLSYGQAEVKFSGFTQELKKAIDGVTKNKIDGSRFKQFMDALKSKGQSHHHG